MLQYDMGFTNKTKVYSDVLKAVRKRPKSAIADVDHVATGGTIPVTINASAENIFCVCCVLLMRLS